MPDYLVTDKNSGKKFKITAPNYTAAMDAFRAHRAAQGVQGIPHPPGAERSYDRTTAVAPVEPENDEVVWRGSILPVGKTKSGKTVLAAPEPVYRGAAVTKRMMEGGPPPSGQETVELGTLGLPTSPAGKIGSKVPDLYSAPRKPEVPTSEGLGIAKRQAYDASEAAGVVITPDAFKGMVKGIVDAMDPAGFDPGLHPRGAQLLTRLAKEVQDGTPISLKRLDLLRQLARGVYKKSTDDNEQRIAAIIIGKIDDFVGSLDASKVSSGATKEGVEQLKTARELALRESKSEILDDIFERADLTKGNLKQSGYENALRNEFKKLADPKNRDFQKFTPEEQEAIKEAATSSGARAFIIGLGGAFSPTSGVFGKYSTGAAIGAAYATANPLYLLIPAGGYAARALATRMRVGAAQGAAELVRGGRPISDYRFQQQMRKRARAGQIERMGLFGGAGLIGQQQGEFNPLVNPNQL